MPPPPPFFDILPPSNPDFRIRHKSLYCQKTEKTKKTEMTKKTEKTKNSENTKMT